ncbi:hypothetical protein AVEN_206521-1 [Araneus ventricosus]|uniref:Uncharacterized protein n=1 Tax=Araneus ventricosus TaxID=182803 RepID=A0A4Y2AGB5_ARAVE|nr:hypothetical protein AVEN_206521-1 [Araneus ventricosus]
MIQKRRERTEIIIAFNSMSPIPPQTAPLDRGFDSGGFGCMSAFYGRKVIPFFVGNQSPKFGCRSSGNSVKKGRPRWPSGKVSTSGPEGRRFETRFH